MKEQLDFIKINTLINNLHNTNTYILNQFEINFLNQKFNIIYPNKTIFYDLVYRKTNESDAVIFHSKCDKIKGTLIIVRNMENKKFGGFITETWDGYKKVKKGNKAFIFSLNNFKACDI